MKKIDRKINLVYDFTVNFIHDNGFPPSIREICEKLNIKSTATAHSYIEKLKSKGLLDKLPQKKRALTLPYDSGIKKIPLIGTIRAGSPIFATENLEGFYPLPDEFNANGDEFALKVKGDSMIKAGIYENDVVVVKQQSTANNGEIVVALIEDSATIKRFYKRNGKVILHPENDQLEDMIFKDNVTIIGVVKGLFRKF